MRTVALMIVDSARCIPPCILERSPHGEAMTERLSRRREARRAGSLARGRPMQPLVNRLAPYEVLPGEGIEAIHRASMRLLKEQGILIVDYPSARETFRE